MKEQTLLPTSADVRKRLGNTEMEFTREDGWDRIVEHIHVHRHLTGGSEEKDIAWEDAVSSWKRSVFTPLYSAVRSHDVRSAFPGRAIGDIYLEVSDHWHYLKSESPAASPSRAADSYARRYGNSLTRMLSRLAGKSRRSTFRAAVDARDIDERIREARYDIEMRQQIWG